MTTEYENAICDFLARKENLAMALEISDHIDAVMQRLGNSFWEGVRANLQRRLEDRALHDRWQQELHKKEDGTLLGTVLCPKMAKDSTNVFRYQFAEEEGRSRYHLYQGIRLPPAVPQVAEKAVADLRQSLLEEGYRKTKGWMGWKYIRDFASVNEFVLAIAEKGDAFASGTAETFWDFFDATRAQVEKMNASLPAFGKKSRKRE